MPNRDDPEYRPKWENRRRVIFGTLIFDALVIVALLAGWYYGLADHAFISVIAGAVILRSTAIIASYVWGAAWEDIRLWQR